jgi:ribosome maturation factor RimP
VGLGPLFFLKRPPRNGRSGTWREVAVRTGTKAARRADDVLAAVRPLALKVADDCRVVVWDVSWKREAGRDTLVVAVDRRGGIGSDELALVSERLSRALDAADAVPGDERYVLEVTSPGAERKLTTADQFDVCVGRDAHVVTADGRTLDGKIEEVDERSVQIDGTRVLIDDIAKARLVVKF